MTEVTGSSAVTRRCWASGKRQRCKTARIEGSTVWIVVQDDLQQVRDPDRNAISKLLSVSGKRNAHFAHCPVGHDVA